MASGRSPAAGSWWRWLRVPWSEWALAAALVAAAAAPIFIVVGAGAWRSAAEDRVAAQLSSRASLRESGVDIQVEVLFDADAVSRTDAALRAELDAVDGLGVPERTLYTLRGRLDSEAATSTIGIPVRLLARPGALDAVDVVERSESSDDGVWISSWFAERYGIGVGDRVTFEAGFVGDEAFNDSVEGGGTIGAFDVAAIYDPIWSVDGAPPGGFWAEVAPELVPTYVNAFRAPGTALVLTDEATLAASSLTGVARWEAAATGLPATLDGLEALDVRYRALERSLVQGSELSDALVQIATTAGARARLTSSLDETVAEAGAAAARLGGPISSARTVGLVIGFGTLVAAGAFFVDRRRNEFRLLAGEGERWLRLGARVGLQLAPVALAGAIVGAVGAAIVAGVFGPAAGVSLDGVPWRDVLIVGLVALAVEAVTAGIQGQRTLGMQPTGRARRAPVGLVTAAVVLAVLAGFLWIQVGEVGGDADIDLAVVALPLVGLTLVIVVVILAVSALLWWGRGSGRRLGLVGTLVWRRLGSVDPGLRLVAGALGVGFGLVIFSVSLVATLDRTVDVKLGTEVGGPTRIDPFGAVPDDFELPAQTTFLLSQDTTVTPGDVRVRVVAVDEETFVAALDWPEEFGMSTADVAELITADSTDSLPVVAVNGEALPSAGAFGATQAFPYRVVGRLDSLPLAGGFGSTLMVSEQRLDDFAAVRIAELEAIDEAGARPPTTRFRRRLVSQLSTAELEAAIAGSGLGVRALTSVGDRAAAPEIVAARFAFDYIRVLGAVAAATALASLALYLSARRRSRALTGVMTRALGVSARQAALATTIEVVVLVVLALVSSAVAVPLVVSRVSPRFDPAPGVPPDVAVVGSWPTLAVGALVLIAVVATGVWLSELRASRRPAGEVMRRVS
ncbi:MAG: hypothetical protein OEU32_16660 [Acidimicrobiia bacterium]|nr:hypothetical protein [Acidimicrobiia bacterium]